MHRVVRAGEIETNPRGTLTFEGEPYGSEVSFFLVHNEQGEGPDLHKHPYPETWIVRSGRARFTADGKDIEAGPATSLLSRRRLLTSSRTSAPRSSTSPASIRRRA
jgi:mannose-6-phosphate isomerase-like protein (cupin superfamily)